VPRFPSPARTAAALGVAAAVLLGTAGTATAAPADAPQQPAALLGDLNLLNGLTVCPGVTAGVGVGNLLGILGIGSSDPQTDGGDVDCRSDGNGQAAPGGSAQDGPGDGSAG
jgi:hypothetical protein